MVNLEREETGRKVTLTFEWFFTDDQWKNTSDRDLIDIAYADIVEEEVYADEKVERND